MCPKAGSLCLKPSRNIVCLSFLLGSMAPGILSVDPGLPLHSQWLPVRQGCRPWQREGIDMSLKIQGLLVNRNF